MISDKDLQDLRERIRKTGNAGECQACLGKGYVWVDHSDGAGEVESDCGPCLGKGRVGMASQEASAVVEELHLLHRMVADMAEEGGAAALAIRYRLALEKIVAGDAGFVTPGWWARLAAEALKG